MCRLKFIICIIFAPRRKFPFRKEIFVSHGYLLRRVLSQKRKSFPNVSRETIILFCIFFCENLLLLNNSFAKGFDNGLYDSSSSFNHQRGGRRPPLCILSHPREVPRGSPEGPAGPRLRGESSEYLIGQFIPRLSLLTTYTLAHICRLGIRSADVIQIM